MASHRSVGGRVACGDRHITLAELHERSARAASGFVQLGVREDDTIALLLRNDICYLEAVLAAAQIGAHSVPINWHFVEREVAQILEDSGARVLVIHADLLPRITSSIPSGIEVIVAPTPPGDVTAFGLAPALCAVPTGARAWDEWVSAHAPATIRRAPRGSMFYTSGTTGRPKGVRRDAVPAANREMLAKQRASWFGHRPGMRTAMIGPMYHSVQASYALAAVTTGGEVELLPRFDAEAVLALIERNRLTHLHLVPTMMNRFLQLPAEIRRRYDLSSLEFVIHGAAPCSVAKKRAFIEWWGPIVHEYYGTTEGGMITRVSSEEWLAHPGTVGRAWPGRNVAVYDEAGHVAAPRTEGRIYYSLGLLPNFTYHGLAEQRAAIDRDGLVTSGDVGYLDEDDYLYLCDRSSDMLISGGVNIYPAEIESVLGEHPSVADCAVFGIPHDDLGEVPIAVVLPTAGLSVSPDELSQFIRARLAAFKVPREFVVRAELPRDESGKLFKRVLRAPYWKDVARRL